MLFPKIEHYQKVRSFADFDEYDGHCHKIKLNKTNWQYILRYILFLLVSFFNFTP